MDGTPFAFARAVGIEDHVGLAAVADNHGGLEDLPSPYGWGVEVVGPNELLGDTGRVPMVDQDVSFA